MNVDVLLGLKYRAEQQQLLIKKEEIKEDCCKKRDVT